MGNIFQHFKKDFSASIVVFFVALPLCLGVALASGAPLFSGIIAGIIGGTVVGILSKSALGVSGPAAGLVTIVSGYILALGGSWPAFLLVVVVSGIIQLIFGYLRLGTIAYYFPSSVINGMLAGIGILIAMKQIPYLVGHQVEFSLHQSHAFVNNLNLVNILIALASILILIIWEFKFIQNTRIAKLIQAPVLVVVIGIICALSFKNDSILHLSQDQLVNIPIANNVKEFFLQFTLPDFSQITNLQIYGMAFVMALVASLETLLCVEATDKLDLQKRITPANRELKAQGLGNIISGLIGGLPITQVIVRSSANISFGAKTKLSTILHGLLLLICAISIPNILNMIPLASLASILVIIGYKLAKPSLFKKMYKLGYEQFFPFVITVIGMVLLDLLKGVGIGIICALSYIIYNNFKNSYHEIVADKSLGKYVFKLADEVSFLNKGSILQMLNKIPDGAEVLIDGNDVKYIHHDVLEIIKDFKTNAKLKKISLEITGINFKKGV